MAHRNRKQEFYLHFTSPEGFCVEASIVVWQIAGAENQIEVKFTVSVESPGLAPPKGSPTWIEFFTFEKGSDRRILQPFLFPELRTRSNQSNVCTL